MPEVTEAENDSVVPALGLPLSLETLLLKRGTRQPECPSQMIKENVVHIHI